MQTGYQLSLLAQSYSQVSLYLMLEFQLEVIAIALSPIAHMEIEGFCLYSVLAFFVASQKKLFNMCAILANVKHR